MSIACGKEIGICQGQGLHSRQVWLQPRSSRFIPTRPEHLVDQTDCFGAPVQPSSLAI